MRDTNGKKKIFKVRMMGKGVKHVKSSPHSSDYCAVHQTSRLPPIFSTHQQSVDTNTVTSPGATVHTLVIPPRHNMRHVPPMTAVDTTQNEAAIPLA